MIIVDSRPVTFLRPEAPGNPYRLGQQLTLDARSLMYAVELVEPRPLVSQAWTVHLPILDQGQVGSCVGDTGTEELATDPVYSTLPSDLVPTLNQDYAYRLYADATRVDGIHGTFTYPPVGGDDTGTTGLAMEKVLKRRGLIKRYRWATTLRGVVTLLQSGPVAMGCAWHESMFYPDANGFVTPTGPIVGGHETLIFAVDVKTNGSSLAGTVFTVRNHWTESWGDHGCYRLRIEDLATLRSEGSDFKQGVPLT